VVLQFFLRICVINIHITIYLTLADTITQTFPNTHTQHVSIENNQHIGTII